MSSWPWNVVDRVAKAYQLSMSAIANIRREGKTPQGSTEMVH